MFKWKTGCLLLMVGSVGVAQPMFPAGSPPARQLDVVDLRETSLDIKLAAAVLQGRVNAGDEATVFLQLADWDAFWLGELTRKKYIEGQNALPAEAYFAKYADAYQKVIVYDPELPASINVATMLASLEPAIVVSPEDAEKLGAGKAQEDLRGRWKTNVAAYRWAFETLWPRMNQGVLACYHPTATNHHLRDYLVRNRVFHFWVTGEKQSDGKAADHAAEMAFLKEVLAGTPVNIPVIGFWFSGADSGVDEYRGVGLAGEYGKITVVCDWATNLSLLSGVRADVDAAVREYRARLAPFPRSFDPAKIYIAYDIVESGDAPSYVESRQQKVWADPKRGAIPINWSLGPAIFELAPPVAAYYYEQATPNDYLYTSISGAGYIHPYRDYAGKTPDPKAAWRQYIALTAHYMQRMDCREVGLYTDAWRPFVREKADPITRRFAEGIPGLEMLVLGMGRDEGQNAQNGNYFLGDSRTLVSHILTRWPTDYAQKTREENIAWLVGDIRAQTPASRPAFMQVMALSWAFDPSDIVLVQEALGEDYVAVTLPQFGEFFKRK